jgi:ATP-dependent Lon protease
MARYDPDYDGIAGYDNNHRIARNILLPIALLSTLKAEQEEASTFDFQEKVAPLEEACPAKGKTTLEDVLPDICFQPGEYVEVFSEGVIAKAKQDAKQFEKEKQERLSETFKTLERDHGMRLVPDLESEIVESIVTDLRSRFPNFKHVIDHLETELTMAMATHPQSFHINPILLHGAPGIGKTAFAIALAESLGVGFHQISAASLQGAFDLMGTSVHWANSTPGDILNLLAGGEYATPVLLIDEVDKIESDERYPVVPALLELLEPVSARRLSDGAVGIQFDASKIIVIATANEPNQISPPLRSRLQEIEVKMPTTRERYSIVDSVFKSLVKTVVVDLVLRQEALEWIAQAEIDIRAIYSVLRQGIGRAVRQRRDYVGIQDLAVPKEAHRAIGFVC